MFTEMLIELLKWLCYYLLAIILLSYLFRRFKDFGAIHSRWQHLFNTPFSSQEFYQLVEDALKNRKIPNMDIQRVTKAEISYFLVQREYLQITRREQRFLICAAPFADTFFVSWWFGSVVNFIQDFVARIPRVGPYLVLAMFSKTYFQHDTDDMFAAMVKQAVNEAIDHMSSAKGLRPLTEAERQPQFTNADYLKAM